MATKEQGSGSRDVLSEDVIQSFSVQERDGSYHVTIPKESARDLGISKGDNIVVSGEAGDDQLSLQRCERFLGSDE